MVSKSSSHLHGPSSPTLSDMEYEIDIELGSQSPPHGRSPPIMPSPEEGPLVPTPPIVDPPADSTNGNNAEVSTLRKRNVGKMSEGAEVSHIEDVNVGRRKMADDGMSSPYRTLSKREIYDQTTVRQLPEEVKRSIATSLGRHRPAPQIPSQQPLVYPFMQLSLSPSKPKLTPKLVGSKHKTQTWTAKKSKTPTKESESLGPITRFLPPNKDEAFIGFMPHSAEGTINMVKRECPSLTSVPVSDLSLALHYDGSPNWVKDVLFRVMPETWPAAVTGQLPLIHIKHTPPPSQTAKASDRPTSSVRNDPATPRVSDQDLMGAFDVEGSNTDWKSDVLGRSHPVNVNAGNQTGKMESVLQAIKAQAIKEEKPKTWEDLVREGALLGIQ